MHSPYFTIKVLQAVTELQCAFLLGKGVMHSRCRSKRGLQDGNRSKSSNSRPGQVKRINGYARSLSMTHALRGRSLWQSESAGHSISIQNLKRIAGNHSGCQSRAALRTEGAVYSRSYTILGTGTCALIPCQARVTLE